MQKYRQSVTILGNVPSDLKTKKMHHQPEKLQSQRDGGGGSRRRHCMDASYPSEVGNNAEMEKLSLKAHIFGDISSSLEGFNAEKRTSAACRMALLPELNAGWH